ncbi:multidrug efflux pump subunit AcrB [Natranaerovirga pectinivora]|uniref:Multidrug efflux pump subunit AcrB n=1 Tax=Natranaerovirga pectinivora TaxID=682400 RepID=A0A4R3MPW0_9FIRM|nr:efflux RND transporter permease subunit [Natranaerovirga pectinivora]TCT14315.1 multidrug efflux pump subunit AcrB [Natranaerovirga pectinivora]
MFSNFSVKKPYTVIVAIVFVLILGVVSFTNMSTDLLPSMNLPYAVVSTTYIGASPEEVEMAVTRPVEQRMASISNIKNVSSISREHVSMVILEFNETTNMDSAVIEMRESLDMIKGAMPDQVGSPMIMKFNPDMMPIMVMSASVDGVSISEASPFIESRIIPDLESVEGIASVSAFGLVENQIHVILREEKLEEVNQSIQEAMYNMMMANMPDPSLMEMPQVDIPEIGDMETPQMPQGDQGGENLQVEITKEMVSGILQGQNFSMPAGYIMEDGLDYLVRAGDRISDFEELENLPIMVLPIPGVDPIKLSDIADVFIIDNSSEMYSKVNGNDAVTIQIQKQTEYTTADVARDVRAKVADIMENNDGVEIVTLMDQGEYIDIVLNSITMNLLFGGILAILILLIFLRDLRPTLIVGLSIPVSVITAFVLMYFSGVTLNIISMGGLALGVGMLVDNSIVVIENIYRMRNEGKSAIDASIKGASQVAGAIFASTLTTVAVFLPIVFTQGLARQIFTDMGLTIAYSLLASLLIALTFVPMMASKMLSKETKKEHRIFEGIKSNYTKVLKYSLKHKWMVILLVLVLFVTSIVGALRMGTELFPASDMGEISATVTMPQGSDFEETVAVADAFYELIATIEDVETIGASLGGGMAAMMGGFGGGNNDTVSFNIILKENRSNTTSEIAQRIREITSELDAEITLSDDQMNMGALTGSPISIDIRGREFDTLESIAQDIAEIIASVEGTTEISDGLEETSPEFRVIVDKEKSIAQGLTVAQVFMKMNEMISDVSSSTTININNHDIGIYVKNEYDEKDATITDIKNIVLTNHQGEQVQLLDIAEIVEAQGFSSISRSNQQRYITVTAQLEDGYNIGLVSREVNDKIAQYEVAEGYTLNIAGENQMINESFRDLFLMLLMGIAFIYLIMVAQFQSLKSPFIVMFTIPLAFTGGFLGLIITGNPISMISLVGLIILCGIVVNNGIVFVDYVNKLREEGMNKYDALITAGNDRLRPIMMTALTTIFALSTLSLGAGEGTEMMQPMAITAIGGLIYSTVLTLIFIPVLYDAFNRKEKKAIE